MRRAREVCATSDARRESRVGPPQENRPSRGSIIILTSNCFMDELKAVTREVRALGLPAAGTYAEIRSRIADRCGTVGSSFYRTPVLSRF